MSEAYAACNGEDHHAYRVARIHLSQIAAPKPEAAP
jgi:hypothetical protein